MEDFDVVSYLMGTKSGSGGGGAEPTSELIGVGHTLFRLGKLRILKIEGFYVGQETVTIPQADRPTSTTSGVAQYINANAVDMTVGTISANPDGSITYLSWPGYNNSGVATPVTNKWAVCPCIIWMIAPDESNGTE